MDFKTPEELLGMTKKWPIRPGMYGGLALGFVLILMVSTMFYSIGPEEQGVVLFLGKYTRTTEAGLHMKLPLGIETVIPVKVERIHKEEFGFRTAKAGVRTQYSSREYREESLMLTGDLNALQVSWIVQLKIKDPYKFLFNIRNSNSTVRDISEAVMRRLVGDYSVDEVLTTKRAEISSTAEEEIQQILDTYDSGIHIVTVKLQDVTPPAQVQAAFNEVNEAKQEKERTINQAEQKYNEIIPKARGEAEQALLQADGYAVTRINRAKGEAARFLALLEEYNAAKEVTRSRLYLETLAGVLAKPREKYVVDSSGADVLPLLDFRARKEAENA
ncbi:MAG: FtsH protease activity modulator HflK [Candidatus Omnitrophica bacterium]|nr:FtsH protease activity modulator HflK [Candidatus Omnitrophota bacterium]